jgi:hypothetical protein
MESVSKGENLWSVSMTSWGESTPIHYGDH